MRKFFVLLSVLIFACSLPTFAKATLDWEIADQDTFLITLSGGWGTECLTEYGQTTERAYHGSQSIRVILTDTAGDGPLDGATEWDIFLRPDHPTIYEGLQFMVDTFFFWCYFPDVSEDTISNIQPFNTDTNGAFAGRWQGWGGLPKEQWTLQWCVFDSVDWEDNPREEAFNRVGFQLGTNVRHPNCTLYLDAWSTEGRDAGIGLELIEDPAELTLGTCINGIKFSLGEATPVLASVYNITGAKVYETAQTGAVGENEIAVDVPAGMYLVKITAGAVVKKGKLLMLK